MKSNPLILSYPMIGSNVAMLVKAIHEASLEGYEPVLSQCHNYFGSVTVTMVKKEGDVDESVGESDSVGNTETSNQTGGEKDNGSTTGIDNGTEDGDAESSDDVSGPEGELSGVGADDSKTNVGAERTNDSVSTKPTRKSTKKAVTPKA